MIVFGQVPNIVISL